MSTPETLTRELAALDDALAGRPVDPDLADLAEFALLVRDERPAPAPPSPARSTSGWGGASRVPAKRRAFRGRSSRCPRSGWPRRSSSSW